MPSIRRRAVPIVVALAMASAMVPSVAHAADSATPPNATVERLYGSDRYATSIAISQKLPVGPHSAILARGDLFADALAASSGVLDTATSLMKPVLLTTSRSLHPDVKSELTRRLAPGDTVLLMGGPLALAPAVDAAVTAAGFKPQRLASYLNGTGDTVDRFDTAAAMAERLTTSATQKLSRIIVTNGLNFPDALSVSAFASTSAAPIVLSTPTGIPAATQKFLNNHADSSTTVDVIGGPAASAQPSAPSGINVVRVFGPDRYATSTAVATDLLKLTAATSKTLQHIVLARGDNSGGGADALSGGPLAGALGAPLLLTDPGAIPNVVAGYAGSIGVDQPIQPAATYVLGGPVAISEPTATTWLNVLDGKIAVPGRSSTFRDTVTGSSATPVDDTSNPGCTPSTRTQVFTLAASGDFPGAMTVTADFCQNAPGPGPMDPNPSAATETVLPGTAVTFTPTGGTPLAGKVIGGYAGPDSGQPPGVQFSRQTTIDFVLDTTGIVGHLNFANTGNNGGPGQGDIGGGVLALVGSATRHDFGGDFKDSASAALPGKGACAATIDFAGTLGTDPFTITAMTWCRPADDTGGVYRISGGTVGGGTVAGGMYTGQVVAGVKRGNDLGLQLRTSRGLVDLYASVTTPGANDVHANSVASPAMLQPLPEGATGTFTTVHPVTVGSSDGCDEFRSDRSATSALTAAHFAGTLTLQKHLAECRTEHTGDVSGGVIEPTDDGGTGGQPCFPTQGGDPTANRTIVFTTTDGGSTRPYRGRILNGTFTDNGDTLNIGLTVLLEENVTHAEPCPLPGGSDEVVDDPGTTFTVARIVLTGVPKTADSTDTAGVVSFAR